MRNIKKLFAQVGFLLLPLVFALSLAPATVGAASPSKTVKEAQTIMKKFGIPAGPIDGYYGPQTARGLCAARVMTGLTPSRKNIDSTLLGKLRTLNKKYTSLSKIPAKPLDTKKTYLLVQEHCQVMLYSLNGYYKRIMTVSTGIAGHETPNVAKYMSYTLNKPGYRWRGWTCSSKYPESCSNHTEGKLAYISKYGNMYNKRFVYGSIFVHGSTSVPTKPASHGCIRVTVANADWMYENIKSNATYIKIVGAY